MKNNYFGCKSKEEYLLKHNGQLPNLKRVKKIKTHCAYCKKEIEKYTYQIKKFNFCCMDCVNSFASKKKNPEHYSEFKDMTNIRKNFSELNKKLNKDRMTPEVREKIRNSHILKERESAKKSTYYKKYGRHEHRIVAEEKLGRKLKPGEVVHHIDGNKHNNDPLNLMIFPSQKEHAKWHAQEKKKEMEVI